jgi:splicing factor 3B subunit 3
LSSRRAKVNDRSLVCSPRQSFATMVTTLNTQGSRIIVGDVQESIHYAVYKAPENRLIVFADDTSPRWTTAACMVDYETVAAGDKFGNLFINRLPKNVSEEVDDDPTGASIMHEKGYLMGAPHRTGLIAHYHVGDIITSIQKVSLVAGGREVLLYTGVMGTVGVLVPFVSNEDVDFFSTLEMHLRTEAPSLVGEFSPSSSLPLARQLTLFTPSQVGITSPTARPTPPSNRSSTATSATNSAS